MIGLLIRALGLLPLPVLYAIGRSAAFIACRVLRWHVPLARENLACSLPGIPEAEREAILAQNYRNMGEVLAESLWGWQRGGRALAHRVELDNRDLVDRYVAERKSVVLLTAHVCNWEWLLLAAGAQLGIPIDPVYKRVKVPSVDRYLCEARSRDGGRPIELADLVGELMLRVGTPRAYGLLADQTPAKRDPKHWIRFLGRETPFYYGFGRIAQFLEAPVVYVAMRRVARGRYRAHLHVLTEPPYGDDPEEAIVQRYAERLEAEVRASPSDWLWAYRRWKFEKPSEGEDPAVATAARRGKRRAARTGSSGVT